MGCASRLSFQKSKELSIYLVYKFISVEVPVSLQNQRGICGAREVQMLRSVCGRTTLVCLAISSACAGRPQSHLAVDLDWYSETFP